MSEESTSLEERMRELRQRWRSLPCWGPNEQGLHILDDVDIEGLLAEFDAALDPTPEPERRLWEDSTRRPAPERLLWERGNHG